MQNRRAATRGATLCARPCNDKDVSRFLPCSPFHPLVLTITSICVYMGLLAYASILRAVPRFSPKHGETDRPARRQAGRLRRPRGYQGRREQGARRHLAALPRGVVEKAAID